MSVGPIARAAISVAGSRAGVFVTSKPCNGPSYTGDDILLVFKHATTRCGKPSTRETFLGPLCDACFDRMKKAREDPHTLGSILKEAVEGRKKRMN